MSPFKTNVIKTVASIPYGKVASYGQIALYVGLPRAARQVGWILNSTDGNPQIKIPWWRVINNSGRISIKGNMNSDADMQRKHLLAEGVEVSDDFKLDIERYRWLPDENELTKLKLSDKYIQDVIDEYRI